MKLVFLPTLADIRGVLGEPLYVDLIWMSRERDNRLLAQERFAKWTAKLAARDGGWRPEPLFGYSEISQEAASPDLRHSQSRRTQESLPPEAKALQKLIEHTRTDDPAPQSEAPDLPARRWA